MVKKYKKTKTKKVVHNRPTTTHPLTTGVVLPVLSDMGAILAISTSIIR